MNKFKVGDYITFKKAGYDVFARISKLANVVEFDRYYILSDYNTISCINSKSLDVHEFYYHEPELIDNSSVRFKRYEKLADEMETHKSKEYTTMFPHNSWVYMNDKWTERIVRVNQIINNSEIKYFEQYIFDKSTNRILNNNTCKPNYIQITGRDPNEIIRIATKEDILRLLILVAIDKGFKKGIKYKSVYSDLINVCKSDEFELSIDEDDSNCINLVCEEYFIYYNGKWSEVIKEPAINFGCDHAEFDYDNKIVKFGSYTFSVKQLEAIKTVIELNVQFKHEFEITGFINNGGDIVLASERRPLLSVNDINTLINQLA